MSAFSMQVVCGCEVPNGNPIGMDQLETWDGEENPKGFVEGRRYVWRCPACHHSICVNMTLLED